MKRARLLLAISASALLSCGFLAVLEACSSNDTSGTSSGTVGPVPEAGTKDTSTADDGSMPDTDSSVADAGSECGTPAALHAPKADGGIYCPFSAPTGGKNVYCAENQQCCENVSGAGVSTCVAKGTACPLATATAWECEDPQDCAGKKCCAHSGDAGVVTVASDTCGPYLSKFSGTRCETTCGTGELEVCETQAECTTGTCTAVKPKGNSIGVCK